MVALRGITLYCKYCAEILFFIFVTVYKICNETDVFQQLHIIPAIRLGSVLFPRTGRKERGSRIRSDGGVQMSFFVSFWYIFVPDIVPSNVGDHVVGCRETAFSN